MPIRRRSSHRSSHLGRANRRGLAFVAARSLHSTFTSELAADVFVLLRRFFRRARPRLETSQRVFRTLVQIRIVFMDEVLQPPPLHVHSAFDSGPQGPLVNRLHNQMA